MKRRDDTWVAERDFMLKRSADLQAIWEAKKMLPAIENLTGAGRSVGV